VLQATSPWTRHSLKANTFLVAQWKSQLIQNQHDTQYFGFKITSVSIQQPFSRRTKSIMTAKDMLAQEETDNIITGILVMLVLLVMVHITIAIGGVAITVRVIVGKVEA
jgi:hypothetical protein